MNLSVLIPTRDFVCLKLVQDLSRQCEACENLADYEILVTDDGSVQSETIVQNRRINSIPHCQFQENETHAGKSRRLNELVSQAKFPFILIIDSDAEIPSPHFVSRYLEHITGCDVLCGGILTSPRYSRPDNQLRFKYEKNAKNIRTLAYRNRKPYQNFTTFNIMIRKSVFDTVRFDSSLSQYGYEDTLFGVELQENHFRILHIDNPLVHTGIDTNADYLAKTEKALQNLYLLQDKIGTGSHLFSLYKKLSRLHLTPLFAVLHHFLYRMEKRNLLGKHPSLLVFKLYKLGYFIDLWEKKKKTVSVM